MQTLIWDTAEDPEAPGDCISSLFSLLQCTSYDYYHLSPLTVVLQVVPLSMYPLVGRYYKQGQGTFMYNTF